MVKSIFVISCGLCSAALLGQVKKQFAIEEKEKCNKVELTIKAKTGNCIIRPSQNAELLNVYSNQDIQDYVHTLTNQVRNKICQISLALKQESSPGVGEKISYQVMGNEEGNVTDKFWKIYLTEGKPYVLDLSYGLGNANIDLSGLSIHKLKIKTGNADVNVGYAQGIENRVNMDTFYVKVDMGSVTIKNIGLSRSKTVLAEVGFGNVLLDFSDKPLVNYDVKGSVAAGNMIILMPSNDIPVLVKINESWLCTVHLCKGLKRIEENTFANAAYSKNPKDPITFDLDVSMGKITFKEKKSD
jgi:hypothetical protein